MRPPPPPPPRPLPTAVVGSYAVPEWLERLKTDYHQRRLSAATLDAIHDVVIKAALKDQERAGLDVVTDGELRRDNLVDHLLVRLPGVEIDRRQKAYYYDYYDAVVRGPLPQAPLGLVAEFQFAQRLTDRLVKYCLPGPHTLVKRLRDEYYGDPRALGLALARVLNAELRALVAAGAQLLQIDEPYLSGYPEDVAWVVEVLNVLVAGVGARVALHICYGNRYGKPQWEGSYRALFPALLRAEVDQLVLEFGRRGVGELGLWREYGVRWEVGMGVVDVKDERVEGAEEVAERIWRGGGGGGGGGWRWGGRSGCG